MPFAPVATSSWHTMTIPLAADGICRIAFEATGGAEVQLDNVSVQAGSVKPHNEVRDLTPVIAYGPVAELSWTAPEGCYNVYRDGNVIAVGITALTYTDCNITDGAHEWSVAAVYGGTESEKVSARADVTNFSSPVRDLRSAYDISGQTITVSWKEPGGLPDNWLISPAVSLPEAEVELVYNVSQLVNFSWSTTYQVLISTTGTEYDDFTLVFEEELGQSSVPLWYRRSVDISEYSGKTIHIAIRHICGDGNAITEGLQIDELSITASLPVERKYNVYRDGIQIAPSVTGTTYTDTGNDGTAHVYTVRTLCEDLGYESHPNDVSVEGSGIDDIVAGQFRLYPNPASDFLHVASAHALGAIRIADMNGRIVYDSDFREAADFKCPPVSRGTWRR